jgi:NADP-dependent 3-hydroxy acid dehydrogenase YdfG
MLFGNIVQERRIKLICASELQSLADELNGSGGKALAVTTDVTHYEQVKNLVDTAVQTYGRIDVMINNAGIMPLIASSTGAPSRNEPGACERTWALRC